MTSGSSPGTPTPDLEAAARAVALASTVVSSAAGRVAAAGGPEADQVVAYDLAHVAAGVRAAEAALAYGATGSDEAHIACAFVADALADLAARTVGREDAFGTTPDWLDPARGFVTTYREPAVPGIARRGRRRPTSRLATSRSCARRSTASREEQIRPHAEHIHRANADIPEEIIAGLAEMGALGLSIPEEYGGFATGGASDYMGMVVATEELSWGSLGAGGSLITRPEILSRALVAGGTDEQKQAWLPKLATGEVMNAVAVTEPDFGSDVAAIVTAATRTEGGWLVNGVKTWCTFAARADVLMLLARTDPDRSKAHRGLSLFVVEKPRGDGAGFLFTQDPTRRSPPRPAGTDGGPAHRHPRVPGNALLRDRLRELVRPRRQPGGWRGRRRPRLLLPDGGLRERPAPDRGTGPRGHAGRLRGGRRTTPPTAWSSAGPSPSTSSPRPS